MPIVGMTINEGATCSMTGGTSKAFGTSGTPIKNGRQVIDKSVSDIRVRPLWNFRYIPGTMSADKKSFSFEKKEMTSVIPQLNAGGEQEYPSITTVINHPVGYTSAQIDELCNRHAQALFAASLADFRRFGATD